MQTHTGAKDKETGLIIFSFSVHYASLSLSLSKFLRISNSLSRICFLFPKPLHSHFFLEIQFTLFVLSSHFPQLANSFAFRETPERLVCSGRVWVFVEPDKDEIWLNLFLGFEIVIQSELQWITVLDPIGGETAPSDGAVQTIILSEAAGSASRDLRTGVRYVTLSSLIDNFEKFWFFCVLNCWSFVWFRGNAIEFASNWEFFFGVLAEMHYARCTFCCRIILIICAHMLFLCKYWTNDGK